MRWHLRPPRIRPPRARLAVALFAVLSAAAATTAGIVGVGSTPRAHAETVANDVLLIHGFSGPSTEWNRGRTVENGCEGTWGTVMSNLTSRGWSRSQLHTIGYYQDDGNDGGSCDVNFYKDSTKNKAHQSTCDSYYYDAGQDGTQSQDIRNISCQLAWWIYNNYTYYNKSVRIIGHSMGGIITRYALRMVGTSYFPPALYVPAVVTLATPHDGANDPAIGAETVCGGCLQSKQLTRKDGTPHLLDDIEDPNGQPPTGSAEYRTGRGYTPWRTRWVLIGSECDDIVDDASAVHMPAGSGSFATVKYIYRKTTNTNCIESGDAGWQSVGHGGYMTTTSVPSDMDSFLVGTCTGCADPPPDTSAFYLGPILVLSNWLVAINTPPPGQVPLWPVANAGFESGSTGWTVVAGNNGGGASYSEQGPASPHSGSWYRAHYKSTAYQVATRTTVQVPSTDTYALSAWIQGCNGTHYLRIWAEEWWGESLVISSRTPCVSSGWSQAQVGPVSLSSSKVYVVEVYSDTGAGTWLRFDDVALTRTSAYPAGVFGPGSGCCVTLHGTWYGPDGHGLVGQMRWTAANGATEDSWAEYKPPLASDTWYKIEAYVPNGHADAHAHYLITDSAGTTDKVVNQAVLSNEWALLGYFYTGGTGIVVHLTDRGDVYPPYLVGADAIRFTVSNDPYPCPPSGAC